jgi:hypothetical protein
MRISIAAVFAKKDKKNKDLPPPFFLKILCLLPHMNGDGHLLITSSLLTGYHCSLDTDEHHIWDSVLVLLF